MWQKVQLSVVYLSCHKKLPLSVYVTKGSAVCRVPCMWQNMQLSVVYLACDKRCSCLLCTLHVTKVQLSIVYLSFDKKVPLSVYVTKGVSVRSVPCRWKSLSLLDEKHHLAAVYLAGEKCPDVGMWDGQGGEDADVRRPEALHSEGGHGQHSQRYALSWNVNPCSCLSKVVCDLRDFNIRCMYQQH